MNSFESGWEIFKPVIAAVNGYCLGYGLTLVTWCDFVIASERADVRLSRGAARRARRSSARSGCRSGSAGNTAMELLLTGERIDAARAKEIGLAGWVVPHDDLMTEARALADRLVRAAPLAAAGDEGGGDALAAPPALEAIRFGETMRKVAGATERCGRRDEGRGRASHAGVERPMKAAVYDRNGPPDVFRYEDVPDPSVHARGDRRGCRRQHRGGRRAQPCRRCPDGPSPHRRLPVRWVRARGRRRGDGAARR